MKIWRITGSLALTVGDIGMSAIDRHVAPAEHDLAFGLDGALDLFSQAWREAASCGRKTMPTPYSPAWRQFDALLGHFLAIELVRNLDQDAGTVALQRVGTNSAAVIQVLQDQQTLLDDVVTFLALEMGDKAHAAGVVLVGGVVQTLPLRYCRFHHTRSFK
jgi:hypothetical protein